ncbi:hypothetical protein B7P43_G11168 [Cryptotermes secundus]|uniref:DNA-repair protein Xrcc1 N-terminal domain-containing protein n=1 Tax=Cryptotermes secundus TaxID=105785 RepID=A0A2J7R7H3_9NEOP|nr:uncharacterized protein LOC111862927 isoform X2 [Cryptotermes secundus]PNF36779.1 hypothetical protein B7P43_G11168 [Cryptotermes secundus]
MAENGLFLPQEQLHPWQQHFNWQSAVLSAVYTLDLLPCSALMSLQESRIGDNKSCVKMYAKDDFLEETKSKKWDQLRVVVTQPFNQQMQFGLCFIRVFSFLDEETTSTKIDPDSFSKWEKMRSQINTPLSPVSSKLAGQRLSGSSLSRTDKILLQTGQQCSKLQEKDEITSHKGKEEVLDKEFFETSILSFMDSLNLQDKNLDNIQLIEVREKMEQVQNREFSLQERRIFVTVVKKYVMSLKYSKSNNMKSPKFSQNIKTDICSKQELGKPKELTGIAELPHHIYSDKKEQISVKMKSRNDGTDWLNTEGDYPTEARVSKISSPISESPSGRRNYISLEDSDYTHESTAYTREVHSKLEGGDKYLNDDSREKSDCVMLQNTKQKRMFKRRSLETDGTNKRLHAANSDNLNITDICEVTDFQENCEQATGENLIQCPVCKVYFEADVIEHHSSECVSFPDSNATDDYVKQEMTCPVCFKTVSSAIIDTHANMCASEMFGD